MKITFTVHAEFRIKKRKISTEEVIDTIKSPDRTLKKHGMYYYQKKLDRGTVEIVAEKTENILKVVTIYWL